MKRKLLLVSALLFLLSIGTALAACSHKWTETGVIKEPTCTETGEMGLKCSKCGATGKRAIKKEQHVQGEWEIVVPATDNTRGTRKRACVNCGGNAEDEKYYPDGTLYAGIRDREAVMRLQEALQAGGFMPYNSDPGSFNHQTEVAVRSAQGKFDLRVDGIAWPETLALLGLLQEEPTPISTAVPVPVPAPTPTPAPVPAPAPAPAFEELPICCTRTTGADGVTEIRCCTKHQMLVLTTLQMLGGNQSDAQRARGFKQSCQLIMNSLNQMYDECIAKVSAEKKALVINSRAALHAYRSAQESMLNMQYGENSVEAQQGMYDFLLNQCAEQCKTLYGIMQ